jgi:hypothetical protein
MKGPTGVLCEKNIRIPKSIRIIIIGIIHQTLSFQKKESSSRAMDARPKRFLMIFIRTK